jgi:decaprenyl-phosphate phosphoribosyltransferase
VGFTASRTVSTDVRTSSTRPLIRLLRPKQWIKNVLVLAAPAAAGVLDDPAELARTLVAFVAFCLAASGTYCVNDAADAEADRRHETKQHRPVASGAVSVGRARLLGGGLLVSAVAVSAAVGNWQLPLATVSYIAITTTYTLWLKRVAVFDIAAVAAGFVVRALAGAAATEVHASQWFLIVASFGSLFVVTGKRASEFESSDDAVAQRSVLAKYPPQFLANVRAISSGVTILAYTLFAFERATETSAAVPWFQLSIIPFVLGILRYALRLDQGEGGAPEELVLGDRVLQAVGATWAILFLIGVGTD